MAADDDEFGEVCPADQLDLDRSAGGDALDMLADRDEPVGLAEGRHRTRALGIGVGGERPFIVASNQRYQQVFGAAALRGDAHRQCRGQPFGLFRRQPSEGADHRCNKLMEGEDRRGGEARQDHDRFAAGDRQAQGLPRFQRDAMHDNARIIERGNRAVAQIAGALRRATGKDHHVTGGKPFADEAR